MSKLFALVVAVVAILGIGLLMVPRGGHVQSKRAETSPAPEIGHSAPDFTSQAIDGSDLRLSSLRGKVVLVNFWATWCQPCRQEMPRLARWYREHHNQGFVVLGVDKEEPVVDVRKFLHALGIPYPVVVDGSGAIVGKYHVLALPESFLIDHRGIVRTLTLGVVDQRYLSTHVIRLLHAAAKARRAKMP